VNILKKKQPSQKVAEASQIPWTYDIVLNHAKIRTGGRDTQDRIDFAPYPFFVRSEKIEAIDTFSFDGEAVLTSGDGVGVGKIYHYISGKFDFHQRVYCIHEFSKKLYGKFFYYYFSHHFYKRVSSLSAKNSVDSVRFDMIAKMPIPLPPISEQQKIASIFSIWDSAIDKTQKLIDQIKLRNTGLAQLLLTGEKRLNGFKRPWPKTTLGDCAKNINIRNRGALSSEKLFAVTKKDGMVPMREHVKGESFDNCKIVRPQWFAYNPMRINIGSIAMWNGDEEVMVSGDYVVFECNKNQILPNYLEHLRKTSVWENFMDAAGNGSVRIRIYFKELANIKLRMPSIEEQHAIATVLEGADKELTTIVRKLANLKEQKKGLMQKLLTGEVRVKIQK
jgi:type I restriction enzyme S subunit